MKLKITPAVGRLDTYGLLASCRPPDLLHKTGGWDREITAGLRELADDARGT